MIKIHLDIGTVVSFPNLHTSVSMHETGLRVRDRCGESSLEEMTLLNGTALSFKGHVLSIKEPYNWKVSVAIEGKVEIAATCITHPVSGMCLARNRFQHPERGSLDLLEGDVYNFAVNSVSATTITATSLGASILAVAKTHLELE